MASERGGMMDLISRSALIENFKKSGIVDSEDDAWVYSFAIAMIESTPTVDAVPVVHASWIYGDFDKDGHWISGSKKVRCPECWRVFNSDNQIIWHWCPQCGAKMDGKKVQE